MPPEYHETIRQELLKVLSEGPCSSKDLSAAAGISEREVYGHLEHIHKSLSSSERRLVIIPAECRKCGFVFTKRERFRKPGKCPVCRGESIREPLYAVSEKTS